MRRLLLAGISGLVMAAAMPRPGIWLASWVGLAPLLTALRGARPRKAALYGMVAGAVYFGIVLYWITIFGWLPWILLTLIESAFIALFAAVATRMLPDRAGWWSYVAIPAAWTAVQWLRSIGTYAFTWGSLAHTQANNLPLIQIAAITGPWGIEFIVCLFNLALANLIAPFGSRGRFQPFAVAAALSVLVYVGGYLAIAERGVGAEARRVRVEILQGNLDHGTYVPPEYITRAFETYRRMSFEAARNRPDVIVWPETTLPIVIDRGWDALLGSVARTVDAALVVGGYDASGRALTPESYNSAHFYNRQGSKLGAYHKVHLVPFGEFVPMRETLPFLKSYGIRDVDVLHGSSHGVIASDFGRIGFSICFESIFPQISRTESRNGASILFVMTNDSWFKRSQAALQHLMMSRLRAVENRRYVVRAASTGMSAIIDPCGRSIAQTGIFQRKMISGAVSPLTALTPYTRFGDYFAYVCLAIAVSTLAAGALRPQAHRKGRSVKEHYGF